MNSVASYQPNGLRYLQVVGQDNAVLSESTSSHTKCLKPRRFPLVRCTLCWAVL